MPLPLPVEPHLQPGLARVVAGLLAGALAHNLAAGDAAPDHEIVLPQATVREYAIVAEIPTDLDWVASAVGPTKYHRVQSVTVLRTHPGGDDPSRDRVEVLARGRALRPDDSVDLAGPETLLNFPPLVAQAIAAAFEVAHTVTPASGPDRAAIRAAIESVVAPPAR